jgi:hypothetical protein
LGGNPIGSSGYFPAKTGESARRMVKDFESGPSDGAPVAPLSRRAPAYFADGAIDVVVTRLDLRPEAVRALAVWRSDAERQRAGSGSAFVPYRIWPIAVFRTWNCFC